MSQITVHVMGPTDLTLSRFQEWPIPNFLCSLTRNTTSHSMKSLACHSSLRWTNYTNSHYLSCHISLEGWENVHLELGNETAGLKCALCFVEQLEEARWPGCFGEVISIRSTLFYASSFLARKTCRNTGASMVSVGVHSKQAGASFHWVLAALVSPLRSLRPQAQKVHSPNLLKRKVQVMSWELVVIIIFHLSTK